MGKYTPQEVAKHLRLGASNPDYDFPCEYIAADMIEEQAETIRKLQERRNVDRDELVALLSDYFGIGNSYHYMVKNKATVRSGTATADNFREYNEEDVAELAEFLIGQGVVGADEAKNHECAS